MLWLENDEKRNSEGEVSWNIYKVSHDIFEPVRRKEESNKGPKCI